MARSAPIPAPTAVTLGSSTPLQYRCLVRAAHINDPATTDQENPKSIGDARGLGSTAPIHNRCQLTPSARLHSFAAADRRLFVGHDISPTLLRKIAKDIGLTAEQFLGRG